MAVRNPTETSPEGSKTRVEKQVDPVQKKSVIIEMVEVFRWTFEESSCDGVIMQELQ